MSTQPLTPAEQAAAEALAEIASRDYCGQSFVVESFSEDARAVVAAVRPLIAQELVESAEIVREFAQSRPITSAEAEAIFDGIAASLSRPTSEEH
jgi:hypothetical protein